MTIMGVSGDHPDLQGALIKCYQIPMDAPALTLAVQNSFCLSLGILEISGTLLGTAPALVA